MPVFGVRRLWGKFRGNAAKIRDCKPLVKLQGCRGAGKIGVFFWLLTLTAFGQDGDVGREKIKGLMPPGVRLWSLVGPVLGCDRSGRR